MSEGSASDERIPARVACGPERDRQSATYEAAGVSIAAGEEAVARIGPHVRSTTRPEVVGGIGGFGGLFALGDRWRDPLLVSTTDGVGTKALVAAMAGRYDTIGIDLVAMCVDDLVCQGAEPLFFLDYISIGALEPSTVESLVAGVAAGCRMAGCALVGGEMAEHPGAMGEDEFDLVGFAVGAVERPAVIDGSKVRPGDVLVGLPSPGLRSNGYSLVRHVVFELAARSLDSPAWDGADAPALVEELLRPSVIYTPAVLALASEVDVHAVAHITGGGLPGNLPRVLPAGCGAVVDTSTWARPRIFAEVQRLGGIDDAEMAKVFNLGIGMVVVLSAGDAERGCGVLREGGHEARVIGEVVAGTGAVELR